MAADEEGMDQWERDELARERERHVDSVWIVRSFGMVQDDNGVDVPDFNVGGGVCIHPSGIIATAAENVHNDENPSLYVRKYRGPPGLLPATLIETWRNLNLSLLKVDGEGHAFPCQLLHATRRVGIDEKVYMFTHENSRVYSYLNGLVSYKSPTDLEFPCHDKDTNIDNSDVRPRHDLIDGVPPRHDIEDCRAALCRYYPFRRAAHLIDRHDPKEKGRIQETYHPNLPLLQVTGLRGNNGGCGCPVFHYGDGSFLGILLDGADRNFSDVLPKSVLRDVYKKYISDQRAERKRKREEDRRTKLEATKGQLKRQQRSTWGVRGWGRGWMRMPCQFKATSGRYADSRESKENRLFEEIQQLKEVDIKSDSCIKEREAAKYRSFWKKEDELSAEYYRLMPNPVEAQKSFDHAIPGVREATVRCEEISDEKLASFSADEDWCQLREAIQTVFVPHSGKLLSSVLEKYLSSYDMETTYFDDGIKTAKRQQLESKLLQLAHPAYQSALGHLRSKTLDEFKAAFAKALERGEGFSVATRDCTKFFMSAFDEGCKDASLLSEFFSDGNIGATIQQASWNPSKKREKLRRNIEEHVAAVRATELSDLTSLYQGQLNKALAEPVAALLDAASNDTWPSIRRLLQKETNSGLCGLSCALSGFDLDQVTVEKMLAQLEAYGRNVVESLAKVKSATVLI